METKGPPVHIRFDAHVNDWITETARRNRMSKPELIRIIVSEKMESLGVMPPRKKIEYGRESAPPLPSGLPSPSRTITAADIVKMSKGKI